GLFHRVCRRRASNARNAGEPLVEALRNEPDLTRHRARRLPDRFARGHDSPVSTDGHAMTALHRNAYRWLADEPQHRTGIAVLQRAIGAALLFRVFTGGPFASFLWGPNGVGYGSMASVMGPLGIFLDLFFLSEIGTRLILVALAVAAAGL